MAERIIPRFYVLHGNDEVSIDAAVARLRSGMGQDAGADLNITEFDGEAVSVAEVLGAAKSLPFLSDKRLVIVANLLRWITRKGAGSAGKKAVERLLEELPELPEYARLVLVERDALPKNNPIVKLAIAHPQGYHQSFVAPKDTTQWIIRRARNEYQSEIEPQAAAALASVTGSDLRLADNELVKLVSYADGRAITAADVALLTPYVAEVNVFAMIDALAAGKADTALRLLHTTLAKDPSEDGFRLFALIVRQFRLLLLTREHLDSGGSFQPNSVARAIGVSSSWQAGKLATQSRAFTLEQLERIYRHLQSLDADMKIGKIAPRLALDLLVASLSAQ